MKPRLTETVKDTEAVAARIDAYEAMGFKSKPYRQGSLAYKPYYGNILLHIGLLLITKGIGNLIYLIICYRGRKSQAIYIRSVKGSTNAVATNASRRTTSRRTVPPIEDADWHPL